MARGTIQNIFTQREVIHKLRVESDNLDNTTRQMADDYCDMVAQIRKRTVSNPNSTTVKYAGNPNKLGLVSKVSSVGTINTFPELIQYAEKVIKLIKNTK